MLSISSSCPHPCSPLAVLVLLLLCLFLVPHPLCSSADLSEYTLLPIPVCHASPTNPSKLDHLRIYFTYL